MGLNIKNAPVHALAKEAARVTGKTQTGAIEEALERLLAERGAHLAATDRERRLAILREVRLSWRGGPEQTVDQIDDLYDTETGLPA